MQAIQSRNSVESALLGHHPREQPLDRHAVLLLDRAHEVGLGAEVVADGGVVALPGGLADLPVGHGVHTVFGEQPLGGGQDRLARDAGPLGANGPAGCGHRISEPRHSS